MKCATHLMPVHVPYLLSPVMTSWCTLADNIAEAEVLDATNRQEMEFRVQLVAAAEKLPDSVYNCEDRCVTNELWMLCDRREYVA